MSPRETLQRAYELAFHPARLNAVCNDWERNAIADLAVLRQEVDWALALHQRLPEAPAVTGRALRRLARYQATARLYRLPSMLRRFRERLGDDRRDTGGSPGLDGAGYWPAGVWPRNGKVQAAAQPPYRPTLIKS